MDDFSFADHARGIADEYLIPDGPSRDLLIRLGELQDGDLDALDLIVTQQAYRHVMTSVKETYRPRSPLEAQLEYDRMRNQARDELGVDMRPWVAAEDPVILDRWEQWNLRHEAP